MNDTSTPNGRLSGTQIVVIVLAVCAAAILAPAGVYAASVQKVKVVGTVATKAKGPVSTTVQGTVPVTVQGATTVQGTVAAQPARPPDSFSSVLTNAQTVAGLFAGKTAVYITSITLSNGSGGTTANFIYDYTNSSCSTQAGYFVYAIVSPSTTINLVFPTPVKLTKPCALFNLASLVTATVTGYRE